MAKQYHGSLRRFFSSGSHCLGIPIYWMQPALKLSRRIADAETLGPGRHVLVASSTIPERAR